MPNKKTSLQRALEQGRLNARPIAEIERDQTETIQWAENVARDFPVRVRRGRPLKEHPSGPSRSVTVRFPGMEAELIMASAANQGLTISEFVRAAAFCAASSKAAKVPARVLVPAKGVTGKAKPAAKGTPKG
jgi:hypothetical protein